MNYKVSKDYPRLKQLLDSEYWVACWVTYDWTRGYGHMVRIWRRWKSKGYEQYSVACRGTGFDDVFPQGFENYTEEYLYKSWAKMNLLFIDPDYERNTLELEEKVWREMI